MDKQPVQKGILTGIVAYVIWGLLPIYWKVLEHISSEVVFAQRIIWSAFFMLIFIIATRRWHSFIYEMKQMMTNKKVAWAILGASLVIGFNWYIYIWAVQNNYVVQASLGYYINPLVSVLLGVIVLKEKLSHVQKISIVLAGLGVIYLTASYNVFPWVSLFLACSLDRKSVV